MSVDTSQIKDRRSLRFHSLDEIIADAEVLAAHGYRRLGNWSLGQTCDHLARQMHASIDGFDFDVALLHRVGGRLLRTWFLARGFTPGLKLAGDAAAALMPTENITDADGLEALHLATNRLKIDNTRQPSPVFGMMSPRQWERCHCRHAELHLSFLVPTADQSS